ncbi:MAG TPA: hypothetical protein GX010_02785 [Erysipelotrichaceae bacterium]|nr:hypothetical protein [Erysipelotrichaceae bacterium]
MTIKFFDIYQKILLGTGVVSVVLSIIFSSIMVANMEIIYDGDGLIESIKYPLVYQTLYSMAFFLTVFCFAWFIIRSATFKLRKKEALE